MSSFNFTGFILASVLEMPSIIPSFTSSTLLFTSKISLVKIDVNFFRKVPYNFIYFTSKFSKVESKLRITSGFLVYSVSEN